MFIAGIDPGYVEQATIGRIFHWHRRFFAFVERREGAIERQRNWDAEINKFVKTIKSR